MGVIEVDPAALQAAATQLTAGAEVARAVGRHGLTGHAGAAGHPVLEFTAATFLQRWAYGCGCLADDADGMAAALRKAGAVYLQIDETAARREQ